MSLQLDATMQHHVHEDVRRLFPKIAPIRYLHPIRFPRLLLKIARHKRRDRRHIIDGIKPLLKQEGRDYNPDVVEQYIDSVVLFHYLQIYSVETFTMLKPALMESLAQECGRLIHEDIPGDFVDVGVWRGGSSMIIKSSNDALDGRRRVMCLDLFDSMDTRALHPEDPVDDHIIISALEFAREYFGTEGVTTSIAQIQQNFTKLGVDLTGVSFLKGNLVSDDFPFDEVKQIALLRIDCDFYTATRNTLARLFPKMQPGATIIFDDYYLEGFGERLAADEFRAALGDHTPLLRIGQSAVWHLPRTM